MAATAESTDPDLEVSTEERLLDVAERMFAEKGIDAVSVRSITMAAGANVAAVHYHFGNKQELIRALLARRVDEVNRHRLELLRALEAAPAVTPRDIAEVWIRPLARLALDPERRSYAGFIVALQNSSPEISALATKSFQPHFARIDAALARALPDVDVTVRHFRFGLLTSTANRALADLDGLSTSWKRKRLAIDYDAVVEQLIEAVAGLLSPSTQPAQGKR